MRLFVELQVCVHLICKVIFVCCFLGWYRGFSIRDKSIKVRERERERVHLRGERINKIEKSSVL